MKSRVLPALAIAVACLAPARADHMSPWGAGWANMPNDIHNTRLDTRGDSDAFLDFIRFGEGADSINRFLVEETAALEAELASGHQVERLVARLDPLEGFLGGGWAKSTIFDADPAVARVLNINVRLRLVRSNGAVANELLVGLAEHAADADTAVWARFRALDGGGYAACRLVYEDLVVGEDGLLEYAVFGLSLKEDQAGAIEGTGYCGAVDGDGALFPDAGLMPAVVAGDVVDIGVQTPEMTAELVVLMGGF